MNALENREWQIKIGYDADAGEEDTTAENEGEEKGILT